MRNSTLELAATILLILTACEGEDPASEPESAAAATKASPEPEAAAEEQAPSAAGPEASDASFQLAAVPDPEAYRAGELGQFEILLEGRSGWHVNQDYPIRVSLSGPEPVRFAKGQLGRDDAAEFGEESARFAVAFTPREPGEPTVHADVAFAMCTDENCVMKNETLALVLPVR